MRKVLIVVMSLTVVFGSSGLALADNVIDIQQIGVSAGPTGKIDYVDIVQIGSDNHINARQVAGMYNELYSYQEGAGNDIDIRQDADTYNFADVWQVGDDNKLVGAFSDGTLAGTVIDYLLPATQDSSSSYNELTCIQEGNSNEVGLYQQATGTGYNYVDILQYNGWNSLVIYQTNSGGYNEVTAVQAGSMSATVIQSTVSGAGIITVTQN